MKKATFFLLVLMAFNAFAQLQEDFNDGDIIHDPAWIGDTARFFVNDSTMLQLQAPYENGTTSLLTSSTAINKASWELLIHLDFNPSSSNYLKIYLVSDQNLLKTTLNGYFIKVGDTEDEVSLFRQDGNTTEKIIDGKNDRIDMDPVTLKIKVTREKGLWSLYSDTTGGTDYYQEGSATDSTYFRANYFGFVCHYSKTRCDKFFFDDINITGLPYIDSVAPMIDSLALLSKNSIKLMFSEMIDSITAINKDHYTLDHDYGNPDSVIISLDHCSVTLLFNASFANATHFELNVNGISDIEGNAMKSTNLYFSYYQPIKYDIVFNEVMADPLPSVGLPEYEYLELFNNTPFDIDLSHWRLIIDDDIIEIPAGEIEAFGFVLFTDDAAKDELKGYGKTMAILPSATSLANDGRILQLRDHAGSLIHWISYNKQWYSNDYKSQGGWALEQIDPENPCGATLNWTDSESRDGGTPGSANSVKANNIDNTGPVIERIAYLSDSSIKIFFDECLDSISISNRYYYKADHQTGYPVRVIPESPFNRSAVLVFDHTFHQKTIYTITFSNKLTDCLGNKLEGNNSSRFAIPEEADSTDVVINEVLFDPAFDGVDFVEIYNRSDKTIDLEKLRIATRDEADKKLKDVLSISDISYLLFPGEYMLLSEEPEAVKSQYYTRNPQQFIQVKKLPAYSNDAGTVVLTDYALMVIDEFEYNEDMHFELLEKTEGVSLERIHYNRPTYDPQNWHSAAQTVGFATPAYQNSQFSETSTSASPIKIEPKVFSPDNDGYHDVLQIHYKFKKEGNVANIFVFNVNGQVVRRLVINHLLGTSGTITWDGIDDEGKKARLGIYIIYFEAFNTQGKVKHYKKTCVLGGRL